MLATRRLTLILTATTVAAVLAPCVLAPRAHAAEANAAAAPGAAHNPIAIGQPWARPTPGGASVGVAYMTLTAQGAADRLIGIATPAAERAELHETIDDNGVMKMRAVDGLALPAGHPVALRPGGYHIMLMGLKQALKTGESFPLTLTFQHAGAVTVTVPVATIGGAMGHDMPHMPHGSMFNGPAPSGHTAMPEKTQ